MPLTIILRVNSMSWVCLRDGGWRAESVEVAGHAQQRLRRLETVVLADATEQAGQLVEGVAQHERGEGEAREVDLWTGFEKDAGKVRSAGGVVCSACGANVAFLVSLVS